MRKTAVTDLAVFGGKSAFDVPGPVASSRTNVILFLIIIFVSSVLNLRGLGRESLWLDELFSWSLAQTDWNSYWHAVLNQEANMVFYHGLLRWWIHLGDSEETLRLLSVLFSVGTIPVVYLIGCHLHGSRAGLIASLLLALNAFNVNYAQEVRGYSLLLLLTSAASLLFLKAIRKPSWPTWAGYALLATAAVHTHLFATLVVAAHLFSILLLPTRRTLSWKLYFQTLLVIGLAILPLITVYVVRVGVSEALTDTSWVPELSIQTLRNLLGALTGHGGKYLTLSYSVVCLLAGWQAVRSKQQSRQELWGYSFVAIWFGFPIVAASIFSLERSVLVERYFIMCLPALVLMAASGIAAIRKPVVQLGVLAVIVIFATNGLLKYYQAKGDGWREVITYVAANAKPTDGVILYHPIAGWLALQYYSPRVSGANLHFACTYPPRFSVVLSEIGGLAGPDTTWLRNNFARCDRVWLILSHVTPARARTVSDIQQSAISSYPFAISERRIRYATILLHARSNRAVP